jgi:hypothetical protein
MVEITTINKSVSFFTVSPPFSPKREYLPPKSTNPRRSALRQTRIIAGKAHFIEWAFSFATTSNNVVKRLDALVTTLDN